MNVPNQHYEKSIPFTSPWLQFEQTSWPKARDTIECDVAIVGGGISGVVTLFYLLTSTDRTAVLFEQGKIANQASGNNAGLACIHIERPVQELVEEFGLEKTHQSFLEVDGSWDLMLNILETIGAQDLLQPLPNLSIALTSPTVLQEHMIRERYNRKFGRAKWHYYVADSVQIEVEDVEVHRLAKKELLQKLQIVDEDFIALAQPQDDLKIGRLNSAEFCHRMLKFLSQNYPTRFSVYEETPISMIQQTEDGLSLYHHLGLVHAKDAVLCTNGYKNFEIRSKLNKPLTRLHNSLTPREGYMTAFYSDKTPFAQGFFDDQGKYPEAPYFYISHINSLSIVGGPEFDQPDGIHNEALIAQRAEISFETYRQFLKNTYSIENCSFSHFWYGIMGYTSNGVRWVGEEPECKHLWYNLGCNGIGITTSVGAAKRLIALMQGHTLPPSIFDISDT